MKLEIVKTLLRFEKEIECLKRVDNSNMLKDFIVAYETLKKELLKDDTKPLVKGYGM